jgi:hypothetical protein
MVIGLTVDVPGDRPGLRIDLLQKTGLAHVVFEERTVDGRERFDRDTEVGSGGAPGRAVLREATARDTRVDRGVILQLPPPGVQDTGDPWEVCPAETLVCGEPFEGERRGVEQGVVREALMRADEGSERLRNGEGKEEVRPRQLVVQVVVEPRRGFMMLPLRTGAVTTGMLDAVVFPTTLALREAVAVMTALARLDGADDLAVCSGEGGITLQVLWRKGGEEGAEGRQGRSPCLRALRRS